MASFFQISFWPGRSLAWVSCRVQLHHHTSPWQVTQQCRLLVSLPTQATAKPSPTLPVTAITFTDTGGSRKPLEQGWRRIEEQSNRNNIMHKRSRRRRRKKAAKWNCLDRSKWNFRTDQNNHSQGQKSHFPDQPRWTNAKWVPNTTGYLKLKGISPILTRLKLQNFALLGRHIKWSEIADPEWPWCTLPAGTGYLRSKALRSSFVCQGVKNI